MPDEPHAPHVLLVEDYPDVRQLLSALIYRDFAPACVYEASTIAEATTILRTQRVDLMLLDLRLPDSEGYKDVRRLFIEFPMVPTAIITGYYSRAEHDQALLDGAHGYYDKTDLLERWRQIALVQSLLGDIKGASSGIARVRPE